MTNFVLTTKLYIPPPRPDLVSRPRLITKINEGLHRKLTLISAPAGFGKTTLVSDWIASLQLDGEKGSQLQEHTSTSTNRVAWLSLDEGDNDLHSFLIHFIAALQTVEPDFGLNPLAALQSSGATNSEAVLAALLNELAGLPQSLILILDDYHVIETQTIDNALTFFLDHLPATMHLVIATRIDPSLPLARLRGRGQLTELRVADLRFTDDEAATFLNQMMRLELSAENIAALGSRTEGWITGLQLAALSLQERDTEHVTNFIQSFTGIHHHVLDYLVEEVLQQQPPGLQSFLLQTSILTRLTGSLCEAVCDFEDDSLHPSDGQPLLQQLAKSNLFIVPLDDERRWYRYHHLFADLLRYRLRREQASFIPELHRRASKWHEEHGFIDRAIRHAIAGDDFEMAADLIEANGLTLIGQGAYITLQNWINSLPKKIVQNRPYLCVYHAWASNFSQQLDAVEPYLNNALLALDALQLPANNDVYKDIQGHIATLQAQDARRQHNNSLAINLLIKAVDRLDKSHSFVHTLAQLNLGLAYLDEGELVQAANSLRNAISSGRNSGNDLATMIAISNLAAVLILQGRLHDGENLCKQTIQDQANRHPKLPPTTCMIFLRLGTILAEWDDVDGYFENLSKCIILANQIGYYGVVKSVSQSMKWYQQLLAEQGRIIEFSSEVSNIIDRIFSPKIYDSDSILEIQTVGKYLADDAYFEIFPGYTEIYRSKKLAQQDKMHEAYSLLAKVYESARNVEGIGLMIEARSAEALIYQSQGEIDQALGALEDALSLSKPEGYIRTYADRGEPMKQLLVEVAKRGVMPEYTLKLLSAFEPDGQQTFKPISQSLVDPLSDRELEVLHLMAQDLSYREIADQIVVSLNTVRTHVKNIYSKLMVHKRSQAIAKARELHLL